MAMKPGDFKESWYKRIPITAAKKISQKYGYEQVIIVARSVEPLEDEPGNMVSEHCTTYGKTKEHCEIAGRIGDFFKHNLMKWPPDNNRSYKWVIELVDAKTGVIELEYHDFPSACTKEEAKSWAKSHCQKGYFVVKDVRKN